MLGAVEKLIKEHAPGKEVVADFTGKARCVKVDNVKVFQQNQESSYSTMQ